MQGAKRGRERKRKRESEREREREIESDKVKKYNIIILILIIHTYLLITQKNLLASRKVEIIPPSLLFLRPHSWLSFGRKEKALFVGSSVYILDV